MNTYRFLGILIYYFTRLLHQTLSVQIKHHPDYDLKQQYLGAFWHGKQFLPVFDMSRHQTKRAVLVSSSKDGEILSAWLEKMGYTVIRGSSRHNNVRALAQMMRAVKEGYTIGYGIDGPIGPIYQVKPGMTHMAKKLGVAIIPIGSAFSRKWIVKKAWDHYEIPKPFAKAILYIGKPMIIDQEADLEQCNQLLATRIHEAETKASAYLSSYKDDEDAKY